MAMNALRTPDERFADLPDFPYGPHYVEDLPRYEGLRLAYIDEGPRDADVVLFLHGEPSWSYLYRHMISVFLEAGYRVIAPDLYGFGRSDKPVSDDDYTWDFHRGSLVAFVERLGLSGITLVVQDWGGLLGLTLPVGHPDLVARLLIMNTGFAVGAPATPGFLAWRDFVATNPDFDVPALFRNSEPYLSEAELAAYGAPFPDSSFMAGARRFPQLVPVEESQPGVAISREALTWWAEEWDGPTFMAVGVNDPVIGPKVMALMRSIIRGCPEPMNVDSGHFVPEKGAEIARAALAAWGE